LQLEFARDFEAGGLKALIAAVPGPIAELPDLPIKGYVPVTPEETLHSCILNY